MTGLFDGSTLITRYLRVVRQITPRKIVNTLLDGSEHVQIIGTEVTRLAIELAVDLMGREMIDALDASGGLVAVEDEEGNEYSGRILEKGDWSKMRRGYYQTTLTLSIEAVV